MYEKITNNAKKIALIGPKNIFFWFWEGEKNPAHRIY